MAAKKPPVNPKIKKAAQNPEDFYTRLIIHRGRQFTLGLLVVVFTLAFAWLIYSQLGAGKHWLVIAFPVTLAGLFFLLIPPTEEWEYKPWQDSVQQVERHFVD